MQSRTSIISPLLAFKEARIEARWWPKNTHTTCNNLCDAGNVCEWDLSRNVFYFRSRGTRGVKGSEWTDENTQFLRKSRVRELESRVCTSLVFGAYSNQGQRVKRRYMGPCAPGVVVVCVCVCLKSYGRGEKRRPPHCSTSYSMVTALAMMSLWISRS